MTSASAVPGALGVVEEEVFFHSRGRRVAGTLYLPAEGRETARCLVHANGFGGVRRSIVPGYGRALAARGFVLLSLDYRGFGDTGGPPATGPMAHVEDVRSGLDFLEARDDLHPDGLGVFGDAGTGGGIAVVVAALDRRVRCVVASAALADGAVWLANMRSPEAWEALVARVVEDRRRRVLAGRSEQIQAIGDVLVPTKERQEAIERGEFEAPEAAPGGAPVITLEYVDELMSSFRPVDLAPLIAPRAAMWIAYESDPVCPADEVRRMFHRAGEPKRLVVISDVPHYARHSVALERIVDLVAGWFTEHLPAGGGPA